MTIAERRPGTSIERAFQREGGDRGVDGEAERPGAARGRDRRRAGRGSAIASSGSTHAPASGHGQVVVERRSAATRPARRRGRAGPRGRGSTATPRPRAAAAASRRRAAPRADRRRRRRTRRSRPSPCAGSRAAADRPRPGRRSRPCRRRARARPRSPPPSRARRGTRGPARARTADRAGCRAGSRAPCSGSRHIARPPRRGSTCQLKSERGRGHERGLRPGQVAEEEREAAHRDVDELALQLARGERPSVSAREPLDGAPQAFAQRRRPIAELALRLGARVRPVLAEHADDLVGELRRRPGQLGPQVQRRSRGPTRPRTGCGARGGGMPDDLGQRREQPFMVTFSPARK